MSPSSPCRCHRSGCWSISGVFCIGGGIVIVPALIYLAGFRQHVATGTASPAASPRRNRGGHRVPPER